MNIAIEYVIRNNLAKDNLEFPCSLFLNHIEYIKQKVVVTINWHDFSQQYLVKQWQIDESKADEVLPPYKEFKVNTYKELFSSEHIMIPMYEPIEFKDQPYKSGIKQYSDGYKAKQQELDYKQTIEYFFNPTKHVDARMVWLWIAFLESLKLSVTIVPTFNEVREQMAKVSRDYKAVWDKFKIWRKHLHFENTFAAELCFYEPFKEKVITEHLKLFSDQCVNMYSWPYRSAKPYPKKVIKVYNGWDDYPLES